MRSAARRQVRSVLDGLDQFIPVPWQVDRLAERLAEHRGRPIRLIPWDCPAGAETASGAWIPDNTADHIFYDKSAKPTKRDQIITHELAHMLLDHKPRLADAPPDLLAALAPASSLDLARRFLVRNRTGYAEEEEAIAEEFATRLVRIGLSKRRSPGSDELGRLADSLR
jgi:hypothetical protein